MKKYLVDVVNHPTTSVYMPNMRIIFIKYEQIVKTVNNKKIYLGGSGAGGLQYRDSFMGYGMEYNTV